MEKQKRVLGDEHPDTIASTASLALTYMKQERCKDVEVLRLQWRTRGRRRRASQHLHEHGKYYGYIHRPRTMAGWGGTSGGGAGAHEAGASSWR